MTSKQEDDRMDTKTIWEEAKHLQNYLEELRRELHQHPETGFDLVFTTPFVKSKLEEMGYEVSTCGKAGLIALAGGKQSGKTILLRSDMDALPIQEETDIPYKSLTAGKMHGCGHDMHTAMLLGAAKLLKEHENEIAGIVKLVFQPAEEIFQGSLDMIEHGMLENPSVDAAVMIHVVAGMPLPSGKILIPTPGISMASCEQYHITVHGKGGHGSSPHTAIDTFISAGNQQPGVRTRRIRCFYHRKISCRRNL
jgi:hippurate hydrolase